MKLIKLSLFAFLTMSAYSEIEESWEEIDFTDEQSHYVFLSGQVNAKIKDGFEPIAKFDGKRLHFHDTEKKVKPKNGMPCTIVPEVVVSDVYAEIQDLEYEFLSRQAIREVNQKVSDMMYVQTINTIGIEHSLTGMRQELADAESEANAAAEASGGISDRSAVNAAILNIETTQASGVEFMNSINERISNLSGAESDKVAKDSMVGQCSFVSNRDIENAYCAISLSFDEQNSSLRLKGIRRSIARIIPIGFVQAGVPNPIRFSCGFSEYMIQNPKVEILLFSGEGEPIANNYSPALKRMTVDQFERYMKLEDAVEGITIQ